MNMPLIQKPQAFPEQIHIKVRIDEALLNEMQAYCAWAEIDKDYFVAEAIRQVFKKDKDWKDKKSTLQLTQI